MPYEADGEQPRAALIEVRPSAVLELTWVLHLLEWERYYGIEELANAAERLRGRLAAALDDGHRSLPDVSILAERIGVLLTDEADSFLRGIERAAQIDGVGLDLRSESADVREATLVRLERLRADPALARRYAAALTDVWDVVRPAWEATGREVVRRVGAEWAERLRKGAGLLDMIPGRHIARRVDQERLLGQRRRVVLTPMYFCQVGGSIVDMTSFVHVGSPARPADGDAHRRTEAELIATRLKVLADGTRVALLRDLVDQPSSVMDLSRRFGLAQPTVSNHVKVLRDAGLLEAQKDGARVVYSVPRDQLGRLLDETRDLLLDC
ncbi:MAG TPA: metalloregulator ArsR/SmtB family transcription factor [Candidatus Dormibacteraeota bacterium]|nr:metalloregulator ArsR/SmtB family transcription factor [Candidatus Dormibacteraeota bacterium]